MRRGVGLSGCITEGNHPFVVLHQEIQNGGQKDRICSPQAQVGQIRTSRGQEKRKHFVFRSNPPKGLQGKDLRRFRLQLGSPNSARHGVKPRNMIIRRETERIS